MNNKTLYGLKRLILISTSSIELTDRTEPFCRDDTILLQNKHRS